MAESDILDDFGDLECSELAGTSGGARIGDKRERYWAEMLTDASEYGDQLNRLEWFLLCLLHHLAIPTAGIMQRAVVERFLSVGYKVSICSQICLVHLLVLYLDPAAVCSYLNKHSR